MTILSTISTSLGSIILLFILTKIMGNKQMSQLSMFDYIIGITIGSIAAEMSTELESVEKPLTAMVVYALTSVLIAWLSYKSIKMRRFLVGKSMILFDNGKLFMGNLKKAKLDVNEFLTVCRNNGYFDISVLQTAILEPNGKISFLPLSTQRPVTPNDLNLSPPQEKLLISVIIDGSILPDNLKYTGNNEVWLKKELKSQGISKIEDVFLAVCDNNNLLSVYQKIEKKLTRDPFQ